MRYFTLLFLVGISFSIVGSAAEIKKSNPWDIRKLGATVVLEETVATEDGQLYPVGTEFMTIGSKQLSNSNVSIQYYEVRLQKKAYSVEQNNEITVKCKVYAPQRHSIECDVKYFAIYMG